MEDQVKNLCEGQTFTLVHSPNSRPSPPNNSLLIVFNASNIVLCKSLINSFFLLLVLLPIGMSCG